MNKKMIAKKPIYIKWVVKTHDATQDTCMDNIKNKFFYKTQEYTKYTEKLMVRWYSILKGKFETYYSLQRGVRERGGVSLIRNGVGEGSTCVAIRLVILLLLEVRRRSCVVNDG